MKPLVSVLITTRNRPELLKRALDSALRQTYPDIEVIVVDDASTEETARFLRKQTDKRVRYLRNERQSGANVSRNRGIAAAKGEFIAGLDDDDVFLPRRIELLLTHYDDDYAFITSNNYLDDGKGRKRSNIPAVVTLEQMLANNVLMNQGLIKKQRLIQAGLYDETLLACQDYDMWMRLLLRYQRVKVLPEATQIIHAESGRQRISSVSAKKKKGYFQFFQKYKHLMSPYHRQQHLFRIYGMRKSATQANGLALYLLQKKLRNFQGDALSVYGTGELFHALYPTIRDFGITVNFLVDSNASSRPKEIFGKVPILPEEAIARRERSFLIASAKFYPQMEKTLYNLLPRNGQLRLISLSSAAAS